MDQELINKVITVSGKEEKLQGGKTVMKIKDQDNLTYTVYKIKQDGTESAAWKSMPSLEDVVQIGFVEQKGEYEGKPVTYRTIRVFNKDIGNGVANNKAQTTPNPLYTKPKEEPKDDKFWDMKAYKQCLWNYWLEATDTQAPLSSDQMDKVWTVFNQIEKDAKKKFFEFDKPEFKPGTVTKEMVQVDELPTIQVVQCSNCGETGAIFEDGKHDCIPF